MSSYPDSAHARASRILVVDDDLTTRLLLQQLLRGDGHEVLAAESGEDALLHFQVSPPDLVLLDVMMPGLDGFATCERMRVLDPSLTVPIVMLTAADDFAAIDRAFAVRATDFMPKPFQPRLLLQRVRYALRTGRLLREVHLSRQRQATARRLAGLLFYEWSRDTGTVEWSDPRLPFPGVSAVAPTQLDDLVALVPPEDRRRVDEAIRRTRVYGERLDLQCALIIDGRSHQVRLVGQSDDGGPNQRVISGALQDITGREAIPAAPSPSPRLP